MPKGEQALGACSPPTDHDYYSYTINAFSLIVFGELFFWKSPSGLKFVDSEFLGGAEVSQGALRVGLAFPGSVEEFTFPTPIEGFGFDFGNFVTGNYADKLFSVRGVFGSSDVLPKNGFFGVVANAGDSLIGSFQTLGRG